MNTNSPAHEVFYRVLLLGRKGQALLVRTKSTTASLPIIRIPSHTRIAEESNRILREEYGLATYCLGTCTISENPSNPFQLIVMEVSGLEPDAPAGMSYIPIRPIGPSTFLDSSDSCSVAEWLSRSEQTSSRDFFTQPGSFTTIFDWVATRAKRAGIRLTGEFRQLNCGPEFSLIRFAGAPSALWFKAVGTPNRHEFPVTVLLARLFPQFLPPLLDTEKGWRAWLALEAPGTALANLADLGSWKAAAVALARLQIGSIGQALHFIDAGCRDLRVCCLRSRLGSFLEIAAKLMLQQSAASPSPLSRSEIQILGATIEQAFEILAETQIPDTLGHGDLNPGNLFVDQSRCIFLDWSEAFIGHPFLAISYLLEYLRRDPAKLSWTEPVFDSYIRVFRRHFDSETIDAARAVTPLLAAFAFASSIALPRSATGLLDPSTAKLIRSLVRRMNREAQSLLTEKTLCVS